jgi:hypothetical protein
LTAEPGPRRGSGPLVRALGRVVNSAVARFPWSWRLLRGPVRRFFDSVAVGWDERVRSDSAEYLEPLVAALDRLEASPGRILDIGTGTGAAALELAARPLSQALRQTRIPRHVQWYFNGVGATAHRRRVRSP